MSITSLKTGGTGLSLALDNNYMEPIATTLLSSTSNAVVFNDIPQTYKHLQIRTSVAANNSSSSIKVILNSDTLSTNYKRQDRKSTRLNSSHSQQSRMPSSA